MQSRIPEQMKVIDVSKPGGPEVMAVGCRTVPAKRRPTVPT